MNLQRKTEMVWVIDGTAITLWIHTCTVVVDKNFAEVNKQGVMWIIDFPVIVSFKILYAGDKNNQSIISESKFAIPRQVQKHYLCKTLALPPAASPPTQPGRPRRPAWPPLPKLEKSNVDGHCSGRHLLCDGGKSREELSKFWEGLPNINVSDSVTDVVMLSL
jgi:hypothetical protein